MFLSGVMIITGLFSQVLGVFIIIYALSEIVDYIYFLINRNKYGDLFDKEEYDKENKRVQKKKQITKEIKDKKAIDADIEEN